MSSAAASIFGLVEDALGEAAGSFAVLAMMLSMVNPVPLLIGITVVVAIEVGDTILGESEGLDTGVVGNGGMN